MKICGCFLIVVGVVWVLRSIPNDDLSGILGSLLVGVILGLAGHAMIRKANKKAVQPNEGAKS